MVQLQEAHSTAWPNGLPEVEPQKSLDDRMKRAWELAKETPAHITVVVDCWDDDFGERFHAWPDKYYCIDNTLCVTAKSEYGQKREALIDEDLLNLLLRLD